MVWGQMKWVRKDLRGVTKWRFLNKMGITLVGRPISRQYNYSIVKSNAKPLKYYRAYAKIDLPWKAVFQAHKHAIDPYVIPMSFVELTEDFTYRFSRCGLVHIKTIPKNTSGH